MKFRSILNKLRSGKPTLAVLIDPDKYNPELVELANKNKVGCFLVGGSKLDKGDLRSTISDIKKRSAIPIVLFPGDEQQLSGSADGLLLLSLLSGRNAEYLIGKHVQAAPVIRKLGLPFLSTAYLLIGGGGKSTTELVTGTEPLDPADRKAILNTCMAAEQLGFGAIYLEGGSGSNKPVSTALVRAVKKTVGLPVIVGGGIDSAVRAKSLLQAGADMLVVGNALEKNVYLLADFGRCF